MKGNFWYKRPGLVSYHLSSFFVFVCLFIVSFVSLACTEEGNALRLFVSVVRH